MARPHRRHVRPHRVRADHAPRAPVGGDHRRSGRPRARSALLLVLRPGGHPEDVRIERQGRHLERSQAMGRRGAKEPPRQLSAPPGDHET